MADITIYRDPTAVNVVVVDGLPPTDQSALVASLQAQVATLQAEIAQARTDAQKVVADLP